MLGNNVIQEEEEEPIIISRNEVVEDISNGIQHTNGNNGVEHNNIINNNDKDQSGKTSQSYLALTKLGMGGGGGTKKENSGGGDAKASPKESKKSDSPMPSKNGIKEGTTKRKGMAEMAASTLKGFTKM